MSHSTIERKKSDKGTASALVQYGTFLVLGLFFGFVLTKAEVISWFRIQEMFRFESFHMYGVIGSAVVVGMISVFLIRRFNVKSVQGEEIRLKPKKMHAGTLPGGILFGFGWALTGACPGPLYALIGNGYTIILIPLASAILGTWVYGYFRKHLPH